MLTNPKRIRHQVAKGKSNPVAERKPTSFAERKPTVFAARKPTFRQHLQEVGPLCRSYLVLVVNHFLELFPKNEKFPFRMSYKLELTILQYQLNLLSLQIFCLPEDVNVWVILVCETA